MSDYLFQLWLAATWQAFALAGVVFIVVFSFGERLQPRWRYLLWCVVLLRLALPVLPETPWGIWNENRSAAVSETVAATQAPEPQDVPIFKQEWKADSIPSFDPTEFPATAENTTIAPLPDTVISAGPAIGQRLKTGFLVLWFSGLVFLLPKNFWNEYRFRRQCRFWTDADNPTLLALFESCRREAGIRRRVRLKTATDDIGAGCFGIFRPVIILSESATKMHENELRMILLHELVHVKRFDPLVLRLSTLLSLIHWPNPLVWFVLSRLQRERELACDAAVLHILGQQKQKEYGLAILAFAELFPCRAPLPGLVGIFEKNGTAKRIDMIIKYKRSKWAHAALGLLLITLVAAIGLTRAQTDHEVAAENNANSLQMSQDDVFVFENSAWKNEKTGETIPAGTVVQGTRGTFRLTADGETGKVEGIQGGGARGDGKHIRLTHGGNGIATRSSQKPENQIVKITADHVIMYDKNQWKAGEEILTPGTVLQSEHGLLRLDRLGNEGVVTLVAGTGAAGQGKYIRLADGGNAITAGSRPIPEDSKAKEQSNQTILRTVDETGKPLGKVDIRVLLRDFKDENRAKTTDENGNMVLRLPESPKELIVSATAPGRVPQVVHWGRGDIIAGIKIPDSVTFTLRKGTTIGGIVVDQGGKPVEGATVRVLSRPNGYGMPGHLKPADSHILAFGNDKPNTYGGVTARRTDRNGRWTLDNVPEGKFYPVEIEITHPDFQMNDELGRPSFSTQNVVLAEILRKGEYRFTMKPGVSVSGTVRDAEGKPVKDALVVPGGESFYYYEDRQKAVRTDAEGKYRIGSLRFGPGTVTVIAKSFAPDMKQAKFENGMKAIDFELKPGKTISFRFVDEKGKSIPKVRVGIGGNPDSWWREGSNFYNAAPGSGLQDPIIPAYADDDGMYRWDWAPEDGMRFSFAKENFLMVFPSETNRFVARPEPYEIVLHHRKIFRGTVTDAKTGKPLGGYKIVYGTYVNNRLDTDIYVWQTSQEQIFPSGGAFEYAPNFKYDKYWLRFTAMGYEPFIAGPYPLEEEPPVLEIALKRAAPDQMVSGRILLPDGRPAAGANMLPAKERDNVQITPPSLIDVTRDRRQSIVEADDRGDFRFEPPKDRDYRLYVAHPEGFAQVEKSEVKDGMTIQLEKYGRLEIKIPYDEKPEAYNRFTLRQSEETRFDENKMPLPPKMFGSVYYQGMITPDVIVEIVRVAPGRYTFQKMERDRTMTYNTTNFIVEIQPGETKPWDLTFPNGVKLVARFRLPDDYEGEFTEEDWKVSSINLTVTDEENLKPTMSWLERLRPSKDDPREGVVEIDHVVPGKGHWNVGLNKYEKPEGNTPFFPTQKSLVGMKFENVTIPEPTDAASKVFDLGTIQTTRSRSGESAP